jgi:chromosome segregation ATPase
MELIELVPILGEAATVVVVLAMLYVLIKQRQDAQTTIITDQSAAMLRLEGHIEAANSRTDRYQERMVKAEITSVEHDAKMIVLTDQLDDTKAGLIKTQKQLKTQTALSTSHADTIETLKTDNEVKDQAMEDLRAEFEEFKRVSSERIAQLENELRARDKLIDKLTSQVADLREKLAIRDEELVAVRKELKLESEKRRKAEKRIDELEKTNTGDLKAAPPAAKGVE